MNLKKPWVIASIGLLAGYMLSNKLATLPGVNKLPKF